MDDSHFDTDTASGAAVRPVGDPDAAPEASHAATPQGAATAGTVAPFGRFTDRYTRFVGWMKWLLPGAAIVLVGLVMMWPQIERTGKSVERSVMASISEEDVENVQLVNPRYVGVDDLDRPYTLTADVAKQAGPDKDMVLLEAPKADITLEDGTWLALTAESGAYFREAERLNLTGAVTIFHDKGYSVETSEAQVDLKEGAARGDAPVVAHGPLGTLESRGFRVLEKGETIIFTGPAKMVFYPDQEGGPSLPGTPGQVGAR